MIKLINIMVSIKNLGHIMDKQKDKRITINCDNLSFLR